MSNGWYLRVGTASCDIDATIDHQKPIRLIPVAPCKFVSGDGNVTMSFNEGKWGDEMSMSIYPTGARPRSWSCLPGSRSAEDGSMTPALTD